MFICWFLNFFPVIKPGSPIDFGGLKNPQTFYTLESSSVASPIYDRVLPVVISHTAQGEQAQSLPRDVSTSGQTVYYFCFNQASVNPAAAVPAVSDKTHYVFLQPFSIYTKKEQQQRKYQLKTQTNPRHTYPQATYSRRPGAFRCKFIYIELLILQSLIEHKIWQARWFSG